MNYSEALEYIHGVDKFGMVLGLDSIKELLNRLGNPQNNFDIIHVAGTNGKGSTSSFISNILIESGYKVGLYTSPFLEVFNERIKINGENIDNEKLALSVSEVKNKVEEMLEDGFSHPTEFEIVTATAFNFYSKENVDILVLEVGLGGRFDATNVIDNSLISVISSISLDHVGVLGDTVEKIAYEKAGIIKKNGLVVVYKQGKNIIDVIEKYANNKEAELFISENENVDIKKSNLNNQIFSFTNFNGEKYEDLKIRMIGEHQIKNAILAIDAIYVLMSKGYLCKVDEESIKKGLLNTRWAGRFELINQKPLYIIDGAHNKDSATLLSDEVERLLGNEYDKTLILGVLSDKDVDGIVKVLVPKFDRVIVTKPDSPRALEVEELAYRVGMYVDDIICIENIEEAVNYSYKWIQDIKKEKNTKKNNSLSNTKSKYLKSMKNNNSLKNKYAVVAAGSLFLIGHIRGLFVKK